ncbi:hypothetical protein F5B22DRAFT_565762 [Xylaria bambusicola]|uniref:uncharacterized protein n=1 Tax=Xylaria bambusicola TaxID=326684 RepID=UPI0020080BA3|nr:uncharacterized protein F5B22DRAFT_565762 [Xylaria bambusicola]KAI0521196.1 hypothetical protein F5B22DRAFT_565762 [Xylaria bambusicola]
MRQPGAVARPRSICQICESLSVRPRRAAAPLISARNVSYQHSQPRRAKSPYILPQRRALSSTVVPSTNRSKPSKSPSSEAVTKVDTEASSTHTSYTLGIKDSLDSLEASVSEITSSPGIPSKQSVSGVLDACHALAELYTDVAAQPHIVHDLSQLDSTASTLLSLDGDASAKPAIPSTSTAKNDPKLSQDKDYSAKLNELLDKISMVAYRILAHQPVVITPDLLDQYVRVQAKLERPETLPRIFNLYASKPLPREGSVPLRYKKQNPDRPEGAIEPKIADAALDAAIATKNLDAAVGIIESSYGTTAFVRSKLLRHGLLPIGALVGTPVAAYILATNFSGLQQTMDTATATNVAFVGILAYVGFTASLGVVAATTANDQMKRVTWAPGMPLRKRWIREEERAALDKVACAWGFQELWRQGEEEGAEWDALREYIGQKGMVLDRTELMEGMD